MIVRATYPRGVQKQSTEDFYRAQNRLRLRIVQQQQN